MHTNPSPFSDHLRCPTSKFDRGRDDRATPVNEAGVRVLAEARSRVEPAYRAVVESFRAELGHVVGYHVGWWDAEGRSDTGTGKAIRPALVLAIAGAATCVLDAGAIEDAVTAAAAVELVHDFTLLHDDVMDGDRLRRGRPTVWARFRIASAVLAGDMLLAAAVDLLAERDRAATAVLTRAIRALCEGQCANIGFEHALEVDLSSCIRMAANKTGALLGAACELGALASGATADDARRLDCFGRQLGLAYQLADDLLGIWGNPEMTGKPVYSDLARRKKSLPVVAALQSGSAAAGVLRRRYVSSAEITPDEFVDIADLVERAGGRRWAEQHLARTCDAAREVLEADTLHPAGTEDLMALVDLVAGWS